MPLITTIRQHGLCSLPLNVHVGNLWMVVALCMMGYMLTSVQHVLMLRIRLNIVPFLPYLMTLVMHGRLQRGL